MVHTGVRCTPEELAALKENAHRAAGTPVIALSLADGLAGRDFATQAWRGAQEECHACALRHGLPEFEGFYGITQEGEFVRY